MIKSCCSQIFVAWNNKYLIIIIIIIIIIIGLRCGAVGWGTALQVGKSQVRFPMGHLNF